MKKVSGDKLWKYAYDAYMKVLSADLEAIKAERDLEASMLKLFPENTPLKKRIKAKREQVAFIQKETEKTRKLSLEEFKKMVNEKVMTAPTLAATKRLEVSEE